MIFLLEGADGAGKTTLATKLSSEFNLEYKHFGIPDTNPVDYWFRDLKNMCKKHLMKMF